MHITWIPLSFPEDGGHAVTDYEVAQRLGLYYLDP